MLNQVILIGLLYKWWRQLDVHGRYGYGYGFMISFHD